MKVAPMYRQPTEQTQNNNNKESPNCVKKNPKYNPGERVVVGGVGGEGGREGMNPAKSSCNIAKHFFTHNTSTVVYFEVFIHTKICQYLKILFLLRNTSVVKQGYFSAYGIMLSIHYYPTIPQVPFQVLYGFYIVLPIFNPSLIPDKCGMLSISCV